MGTNQEFWPLSFQASSEIALLEIEISLGITNTPYVSDTGQSYRMTAHYLLRYPLICRQGTMLIAPREIGRTALAHL